MEWAQVLAIVLPVMFTIIIGICYNNRRIDDLRSDMNSRLADVVGGMNEIKSDLKADLREFRADVKTDIREMRSEMKEIRTLITESFGKELST